MIMIFKNIMNKEMNEEDFESFYMNYLKKY